MGWIQDEIIKTIETYFNSFSEKLSYDKTMVGKIISISNNIATVEVSENELTCRIKADINVSVGDVVLIKIPNNNKNLKYVDGKLL